MKLDLLWGFLTISPQILSLPYQESLALKNKKKKGKNFISGTFLGVFVHFCSLWDHFGWVQNRIYGIIRARIVRDGAK